MDRRNFINKLVILAPLVLIGLPSCNALPNLDALKQLGFPILYNTDNFKASLNMLIVDLNYTGKESQQELLDSVLSLMKADFAQNKTELVNGWFISRTEIVLSNISAGVL